MNRIAAMQPYFLPFAGYFRLMCDVDVFVLLDDVQFRKGGWIHRNRLRTRTGDLSWLTFHSSRRLSRPSLAIFGFVTPPMRS